MATAVPNMEHRQGFALTIPRICLVTKCMGNHGCRKCAWFSVVVREFNVSVLHGIAHALPIHFHGDSGASFREVLHPLEAGFDDDLPVGTFEAPREVSIGGREPD